MNTVKIGNHDVSKDDVGLYIQHFERNKEDLSDWEHTRKELHDRIFNNLGLERFSEEGLKFGEALDIHCEPKIEKSMKLVSDLKKLSRAKTKTEQEKARKDIDIEILKIKQKAQVELMQIAQGFRGFSEEDDYVCRVCGLDCVEGVARINDHLAIVPGFAEINSPICMKCSDTQPDEYNVAFRKRYWSK